MDKAFKDIIDELANRVADSVSMTEKMKCLTTLLTIEEVSYKFDPIMSKYCTEKRTEAYNNF